MVKQRSVPSPSPDPELPSSLRPVPSPSPLPTWNCYQVTDVVHALPAGLWDSDVVSEYEFCRLDNGMFVRIRSPMGIVIESTWTVDETTFLMIEEIFIKASRLLMPVLRGQCEKDWKKIHEKMLEPLAT